MRSGGGREGQAVKQKRSNGAAARRTEAICKVQIAFKRGAKVVLEVLEGEP